MQLAVTEIRIVAVGFAVSPREVYYARENAPFERAGLSDEAGSAAVGLAAAGPDQGVAVGAFVFEEAGVDRSVEPRIVQLDREIIAALA